MLKSYRGGGGTHTNLETAQVLGLGLWTWACQFTDSKLTIIFNIEWV